MTANVAQVFLHDDEWVATLRTAREALRPGGHLVFEVRDPQRAAWREWNRTESYRRVAIPGGGSVESWVETALAAADLALVDVRDAPDRPGLELVFIALRPQADAG